MFQEYQKPSIDWLIEKNILKIDKDKKITLCKVKVTILSNYMNTI